MPVTKCEPETTRKASRKSAKTQETVLSALLAQTEEVSVPLASLIKSPLNVRTVPYSAEGTVAKLAMRQPFVLFKGLTFQKLCLPGAFRPGDHHNKMLRPGLCVVHASPQYL